MPLEESATICPPCRRATRSASRVDAQKRIRRPPKTARKSSKHPSAAQGTSRGYSISLSQWTRTVFRRTREMWVLLACLVSYLIQQVRLLTFLIDLANGLFARIFAVPRWLNDYPARMQFRRTTQRFLSVMNTTESYATFVEAAASLDHYCGAAKWAQDAPPLERCNAVGLLVDATAAQHLVRSNNIYAMETFLCSLLRRNAHGIMDPSIYCYYHSAPQCLEDYIDSIRCLIMAYAGRTRRGEPLKKDISPSTERHTSRLSAAPMLHELHPCWARLEGGTGTAPVSPLRAGRRLPLLTTTKSGSPATLPAVDLAAKIQQVWQTQLRRLPPTGSQHWRGAAAALTRQESTSLYFQCVESSSVSAAIPLTTRSTRTLHSDASTQAWENDTHVAKDDLVLIPSMGSSSCATAYLLQDEKRSGSLSNTPPPQTPLLRTEEKSASSVSFPLAVGAPVALTSPHAARISSAVSLSPEAALIEQLTRSCASLCSFLDGCAFPSAQQQQYHPEPKNIPVNNPTMPTVEHRLSVLRKVLHSFGRTALVLSGGASMGTYHAGVVRALHEADVLPDILCGSSAGSIIAALICTKSPDELHAFMKSHVLSTEAMHLSPFGEDSGLPGKLRRFFKTGSLMDVRSLMECMRSQCGDITFREAYHLSGKVLNVSVTRSVQEGMTSDRHSLLNYVTAPDVVIWNAVSASCALPGLFTAVQLIEKSSLGGRAFVPYLPGELWCDGSIAQDIPRYLLSQLFNVNYLIVSQVNPYVIPFLRPPKSTLIGATSCSWLTQLWFGWVSLCSQVLTILFTLHLLPRSGRSEVIFLLFAQYYGGDLTIQPVDSVLKAVPDYLNLLNNPSADYISYVASRAQSRTWPLVTQIRLATSVERCLQREIRALEM